MAAFSQALLWIISTSFLAPTASALVQPGGRVGHEASFLATAAGDRSMLRDRSMLSLHIDVTEPNATTVGTLTTTDKSGSNVYKITLWPLLGVTIVLAFLTRPRVNEPLPEGFLAYMVKYLAVWYVAVFADWLQGPYVYELYSSYGYASNEIAALFVVGFGSSAVFGTFVGSIADKYGRKRCAVLYCLFYIVSCATKHVNQYWVLMFGRLTGGIATSLLFSTFECWLVAEHCEKRKFSNALLRYMFGMMYFGSYVSAIIAGIVAQAFVDAAPLRPLDSSGIFHVGGCTVPFDMAGIALILLIAPICLMWDENFGDGSESVPLGEALKGVVRLLGNPGVLLLGIIVAAFESSMYAFVFNWTPALDTPGSNTPHGLVFSLFMMACTSGSSVFSMTNPKIWPAYVLFPTVGLGTAAMAIVIKSLHNSTMQGAIFFMFLIFEFCCGVYFPAIGALKSSIVPEAYRAGVYNAYRVPLNVLVCLILLVNMTLTTSFVACTVLLGIASSVLLLMMTSPEACRVQASKAELAKGA